MPNNPNNTVAVALSTGYRFIATEDILYCEAEGNYTHLYLDDGQRLSTAKSIKQILNLLPSEEFVRIHHSYAVNLDHVLRLLVEPEPIVELRNGSRINVSRRKKRSLLDHYFIL